jgi:hypothetical protein
MFNCIAALNRRLRTGRAVTNSLAGPVWQNGGRMTSSSRARWLTTAVSTALALGAWLVHAQSPQATSGQISPGDLKTWLSYIASDELGGRGNFSEGLGLAASYVADRLGEWGVKPGGDAGTYFQTVSVLGVNATGRSTVTIEVNGRSRTFKDGEGVTFPKNVGGKRRFTVDGVEFVGYGLYVPQAGIDDYARRDLKGKAVVWLGARGPGSLDPEKYRRALFNRSRYPLEMAQAVASVGPVVPPRGDSGPNAGPGQPAARGGGGERGQAQGAGPRADFTTVQRLDRPVAPAISGSDEFLEFLFSASGVSYADLKQKAEKRQPLPSVSLRNVKLTFDLEADYEIVRTQLTRNVVGIVEGTDPALRDTFVAYGAHYDHVGYSEGGIDKTASPPRRQGAVGRVTDGALDDRVWNGADDDGSGTVALLGIARAFASGPRPRRSIVLVWHTGEERGLWGSRYFVDYPPMPIDRIVAELNLDMVGRNRDDKASESNTVYLVGSDRISSELHALSEATNRSLPSPMKLDYEMNDPADPEQLYYRSDHYSYALAGIPVIFYTTGLHPDYHAHTDSEDKLEFPKLARIAELAYATGRRVADLDHAPARDNKGPRAGRTTSTTSR